MSISFYLPSGLISLPALCFPGPVREPFLALLPWRSLLPLSVWVLNTQTAWSAVISAPELATLAVMCRISGVTSSFGAFLHFFQVQL